MLVKSWRADKVPRSMIQKLASLTLPNGNLWECFLKCRVSKAGKVFVVAGPLFGEPVGWLLLRDDPAWEPTASHDAMVFVSPFYRRSGYGSKLYQAASKVAKGNIVVYPWDWDSEDFFAKFSNIIERPDWFKEGLDLVDHKRI